MLKLLFAMLLLPLPGRAMDAPLGNVLNGSDRYALAQKLIKALLKCKQVREHPAVSVEIENHTGEAIDEAGFAGLIQSMEEWRTPLHPEAETPRYQLHVALTVQRKHIRLAEKATYYAAGELKENGEPLCRKTVKLVKRDNGHRSSRAISPRDKSVLAGASLSRVSGERGSVAP